MDLLGCQRLAAFRAGHDRFEHLSAGLVLMQHWSATCVDHVDIAPMDYGHDDGIKVEALARGQAPFWTITGPKESK